MGSKPAVVKALLDSAPAILTAVDVRDPKEFAEGYVPGAINIPVESVCCRLGSAGQGQADSCLLQFRWPKLQCLSQTSETGLSKYRPDDLC